MYKLLIVDDERLVIDGLVELIERNRLEDLEIHKAFSADDAVEILKKKKIDIVITDISMPGMSGIEFQSVICEHWPLCKVIFLTAYNHFEYAQSALRNDGVDFILKTESEDRIIGAIHKAILLIERDMKHDELLQKAKQQIKHAHPLLKIGYLMEIIHGANYSDEERLRLFNEFNIPLDHNLKVLLLVGRIDHLSQTLSFDGRMEAIYTVQDLVSQYLSQSARVDSVIFEGTKFLWIIQPSIPVGSNNLLDDGLLWSKTISFVHGTLDYIQNVIKKSLGLTVSFVTGSKPYSWDYVGINFDYLKFALNRSAGISKEVLLLDCNNLQAETSYDNLRISTELKIQTQLKKIPMLESYLADGERKKFLFEYSSIMNFIQENNFVSESIKREVYYHFAMMFLSYLLKSKLIDKMNISIDSLTKMDENKNWKTISDDFLNLAQHIFDYKQNEYIITTNNIVKKVNEYIENNINKDLSLAVLSDIFNFNPQYLSRIYKQNTGKSISEYIWDMKLSKAKELLSHSNIKINDIAFALGFNTPSYFTYFFKKNMNMSPQQYREIHG